MDHVYRSCVVTLQGFDTRTYLILLDMFDFDVIIVCTGSFFLVNRICIKISKNRQIVFATGASHAIVYVGHILAQGKQTISTKFMYINSSLNVCVNLILHKNRRNYKNSGVSIVVFPCFVL